jgi:hypothetical protein
MRGAEWRAEAKRELAAQAAQQRRQPHRPRARGVQAVKSAGMVRLPPAGPQPAEDGASQSPTGAD